MLYTTATFVDATTRFHSTTDNDSGLSAALEVIVEEHDCKCFSFWDGAGNDHLLTRICMCINSSSSSSSSSSYSYSSSSSADTFVCRFGWCNDFFVHPLMTMCIGWFSSYVYSIRASVSIHAMLHFLSCRSGCVYRREQWCCCITLRIRDIEIDVSHQTFILASLSLLKA